MKNVNQLVEQRIKSNSEYLDKMQDTYSKLNVIRIDLGYTKKSSKDITLEIANNDMNKLHNNKRSKPTIFEDNVGYIIKTEQTSDKGVHFHAIFLYDGQKIRQDITKADQIGEYWKNEITKGKGLYHNCNKNTYEKSGVGMLEHSDKEKRKNLDKVIEYLCKEEQSIDEIKTSTKDRSMKRGTIPKLKDNRGRPRKISD